MLIKYPSPRFAEQALHALKAGDELIVSVEDGWRARWLEGDLPFMTQTEEEACDPKSAGKRFPSTKVALLLAPFLTVHHFALSAGYLMNFSKKAQLEVRYTPRGSSRA